MVYVIIFYFVSINSAFQLPVVLIFFFSYKAQFSTSSTLSHSNDTITSLKFLQLIIC